jgi:HEAT repeat protein
MTPEAGRPTDARPSGEVGTIEEGPLAEVLAALARDDPQAVVQSLDGRLHHGRPGSPAALRQQVGERLAVGLAAQGGRITRWIDALSTSQSPTGRQVACLLLASRYEQDRSGVLRAAEQLAEDPHWEVREAAAGLLGTILDRDFRRVLPRLEALRQSRSENLRRAVVMAARYAARRDKPERVEELLGLLEPLLRDPTPYVRRNLGPFAIGDALLRVDPKTTLRRLREWSRDRDQIVRWNVAMAFSSAIGSFHWPAAKSILERLATSPEPIVRMAVAKAVRRCRQRYTEDVDETLRRWMQDRNRAAAAQLVGNRKR